MTNASKARGTAAETAIVRYLQGHGFPNVERRTLSGAADRGDIAGLPGWCIEVKNTVVLSLSQWMKELHVEMRNAGVNRGAVWFKKSGTTDPGDWYVLMNGRMLVEILRGTPTGTTQWEDAVVEGLNRTIRESLRALRDNARRED